MKRFLTMLFSLGLVGLATNLSAETTAPNDVVIENLSISKSLTGVPGDAAKGREIFLNRKQGNCLACHANSDMNDQLFHGEVGPSLDGAGARWQEGMLRTILVNAKAVFTEQTVMPGFYTLDVGANVRKDLIGKTILEAQQIEDLVAYLMTLK
jgi:sulfur-oxidizing protein SoxX